MGPTKVPTTMQALTLGTTPQKATIALFHPLPSLTPKKTQLVVKVLFAAQNPPDVFSLDIAQSSLFAHPQNVMGSDFSGVIVSSKSTSIPSGSRVCGFVPGNATPVGAFAEYLVVDEEMVIKVPDNGAIEMDEASTLGMSILTALGALGRWLGLNLDPDSTTGAATTVEKNETKTERLNGNSKNSNGCEFESRTTVLVWGGSTAVGHYAIQLLKLAGRGKRFTVITTGSRASIPRLQKLGADVVLAREDGVEENLKEIKKASLAGGRGLAHALDCFSSQESAAACARALSSSSGEGRLHTLFPVELPEDVSEGVRKTFGLVHTLLGPEYADLSVLDWMNPRPTKEE